MTRRAFLSMPMVGLAVPIPGSGISNDEPNMRTDLIQNGAHDWQVRRWAQSASSANTQAEGFVLTAPLQEAGDIGYYALSNHVALMIHPDSALLASTNALIGASVVLSLKRADK